ncbi:MAG: glycoside hydrolase family 31 protein [Acidobacteriaceae bacterium]|nr:glycoside hydrolase family 31 protein [Acidobacteriaceae bacterium]
MSGGIRRRDAIFLLGGSIAGAASKQQSPSVRIVSISPTTLRIIVGNLDTAIPDNGCLLPGIAAIQGKELQQVRSGRELSFGGVKIAVQLHPLVLEMKDGQGRVAQRLEIDSTTGAVTFGPAAGPILGLGEGGEQFDRRGSNDDMRNGQIGQAQRTFGARVPVPFVIGTDGWALFFNQPQGSFDFRRKDECRFVANQNFPTFPLDLFVIVSRDPAVILREYAQLTGLPAMPPLWSLGYQQSHRTLASREEVLAIARAFREKRLPCDVLIYLGTGFCPSGWNTGHGSFTFNASVFPDPENIISQLHKEHFRVVLHTVFREPVLRGSVRHACTIPGDSEEASCYWKMHEPVFAKGVDGWWPDEGDQLDVKSRLCRDRLYYEGPLLDRPNLRPFALHRNGAAGSQRFGAFLWSGDISSRWETLRVQVPVAINTGLSGLPFWGTDTGGFIPTKELTGELYVRWFQFNAFCPLFRSHGRSWKLRLPWQWNTGELGPSELSGSGSANPDESELHNAAVEPICRKYLELRYRLMPYLYSLVRETHETGLPIMRSLWIHYADDPNAVCRGDEYLWGRDILVAPVVAKGAKTKSLYLPRGQWYDFWDEAGLRGGREIVRDVDLETIPLFVRAGAIIPFGPLKQHTAEPSNEPIQLRIYPGANGRFVLYEDDGLTYNFEKGDFTQIRCEWDDNLRTLNIIPEHGLDTPREFLARVVPDQEMRRVIVRGTERIRL